MKNIFYYIIAIALAIIGTISTVYAIVMQVVLSYQKFGVIINGNIIIPDWSLLGFLGIIPLVIAVIILETNNWKYALNLHENVFGEYFIERYRKVARND